jgi:hypothetical protein
VPGRHLARGTSREFAMKKFTFAAIAIVLGVVLGLSIILMGLCAYVVLARAQHQDVHPRLRNYRLVQQLFFNEPYLNLVDSAKSKESDNFSTVWDFNDSVKLSKALFVPTEMFGETKYLYRPNLGIFNCRIWSGLHWDSLILAESPRTKENIEGTTNQCIHFRTNAYGFKEAGFYSTAGSKVFFLGDSFTEGLWTAPANTFSSLVGRMLNKRNIPIYPINLGVNGYSALEMAWTLEKYGPIFEPSVVIVNSFPNDIDVDYNAVACGVKGTVADYKSMFFYLEKIREYTERTRAHLVVVAIPSREQVRNGCHHFQDHIKLWAGGRKIMFLDPTEYFSEIGIEKIYLSWDPHFSVSGHELYARFLTTHLAPLFTVRNMTVR